MGREVARFGIARLNHGPNDSAQPYSSFPFIDFIWLVKAVIRRTDAEMSWTVSGPQSSVLEYAVMCGVCDINNRVRGEAGPGPSPGPQATSAPIIHEQCSSILYPTKI